jgi:hypothetical protein
MPDGGIAGNTEITATLSYRCLTDFHHEHRPGELSMIRERLLKTTKRAIAAGYARTLRVTGAWMFRPGQNAGLMM